MFLKIVMIHVCVVVCVECSDIDVANTLVQLKRSAESRRRPLGCHNGFADGSSRSPSPPEFGTDYDRSFLRLKLRYVFHTVNSFYLHEAIFTPVSLIFCVFFLSWYSVLCIFACFALCNIFMVFFCFLAVKLIVTYLFLIICFYTKIQIKGSSLKLLR